MVSMSRGYEDLEVWQFAKNLAVKIYAVTDKFPTREQFGISAQIRKSAVSIPSNIAEGSVKESKADFGRFLLISMGSTAELKTQLIIAKETGILPEKHYITLIDEINRIAKMLKSLKSSLTR